MITESKKCTKRGGVTAKKNNSVSELLIKERAFLSKRFMSIVFKWCIIFGFIIYLGYFGLFDLIFIYLPWLIIHTGEVMIEWFALPNGGMRYLKAYWFWWMLAIIHIIILIYIEYKTHYRHKRRDLDIGGEFEGRVIWIKGIRQGLIYDIWDFKNYLNYLMNKKKDMDYLKRRLEKNIAIRNGTRTGALEWPDPWAIPLGAKNFKDYIVYYKIRFFQLIPMKLYVPSKFPLHPSFFHYWLPNKRIVNFSYYSKPGIFARKMTDDKPIIVDIEPEKITSANQVLLSRSNQLVESAILSDPETIKVDFAHGTLPMLYGDKDG